MNEWLWILQLADHRSALNLDEWADPRIVADRAPVEVRERLDDDLVAELDADEGAIRASLIGPSATVEPGADALDNPFDLCFCDSGEHRKREGFPGDPLGGGERPSA